MSSSSVGRDVKMRPGSHDSPEAEASAIEAARCALVDAFSRGDVSALATMLTADALWVLPGRAPLSGRTRIAEMLADAFGTSTYRLHLEPDELMVGPSSTAEDGVFESMVVDDEGSPSPPHVGRYLLVWRSCDDGWRVGMYVTAPVRSQG